MRRNFKWRVKIEKLVETMRMDYHLFPEFCLLLLLFGMPHALAIPHYVHPNNSAIPTEIYARHNLTTDALSLRVFYGGDANASNGSAVADFFDAADTDTNALYSSTYTYSSFSFRDYNSTSKKIILQVASAGAEQVSAGTVQQTYCISADIEYNVPSIFDATYKYHSGPVGTASGAATGNGIGVLYSAAEEQLKGVKDGYDYYNVTKMNNTPFGVVFPIRACVNTSSGALWGNFTYPGNNTQMNWSGAIPPGATAGTTYYGIRVYSSRVQFDNLMMFGYCPQPSISYGSETVGTFAEAGTNFTKYRDINITSAGNYSNCTFTLPYAYFNSTELAITNSTSTAPVAAFVAPTPANGSSYYGNLTVNATISATLNVANLSVNGSVYNMTCGAVSCIYSDLFLGKGNYGFGVLAYNNSNASMNASTGNYSFAMLGHAPWMPNLTTPANFTNFTSDYLALNWSEAIDPDNGTITQYEACYGLTTDATNCLNMSTLKTRSVGALNYSLSHYWRVRAWDSDGNQSGFTPLRTFNLTPSNPVVVILSPSNGSTITSYTVPFSFTISNSSSVDCWVSVYNANTAVLESNTSFSCVSPYSKTVGTYAPYYADIYAMSSVGNVGNDTVYFTTSPFVGGGGGGGGGGGTAIIAETVPPKPPESLPPSATFENIKAWLDGFLRGKIAGISAALLSIALFLLFAFGIILKRFQQTPHGRLLTILAFGAAALIWFYYGANMWR